MERQRKAHELIDEPTRNLVRRKACHLARRQRCVGDPSDAEQEVLLQLLRRCHRFNPQKASWPAFATIVCHSQLLSLLERHCAHRRCVSKEAGSLNARAKHGYGDELVALLASDCHVARLGGQQRSEQEQSDLRSDLQAAIALLPALQQQICERLKVDCPADVARDMGISRGALYDQIVQIRAHFDQARLREYV